MPTDHPSHPTLAALATAVPRHVLSQDDVRTVGERLFHADFRDLDRMLAVYPNAGIERRYSCVPLEWYLNEHSFGERNALYIENAVALLEEAAAQSLDQAGLTPGDIDIIVVVSTSGIATPSLDALLMETMPFRRDVMRLPIFGLGCAGGVIGLSRAAAMARAHPGARVLYLCVELCGLTFRHLDRSKSNFIATALFGDGAAAAVIATDIDGAAMTHWGEHTWPQSLDIMGWNIVDDGFGVLFSRDIPAMVRQEFRRVTEDYLSNQAIGLDDIDAFLCHPGGAKVVAALEDALDLGPDALALSRETLRDYGNMSAATVLFVLARALDQGKPGRCLLSSLGPGFSAGFLTLDAA
ncbi:MAG: 3-oxoacyl-[acyl-carrier-protein] synthase III C-terminal domain-containing protein [Pseudomonadota bacterium]